MIKEIRDLHESMENDKKRRIIIFIFLFLYAAIVILFTLINRGINLNSPHYSIFWSYKEWIDGNKSLGRQIIGNIVLFFPIGYLINGVTEGKSALIKTILVSVFFSGFIEIMQLLSMRGMFECDDIINNSLGAIIGWITNQITGKKTTIIVGGSSIILISICMVYNMNSATESNYTSVLCFQIDSVEENSINGFCFRCGRNASENYDILLKSTDYGEVIKVNSTVGLDRIDVNDYFEDINNFTKSGFACDTPAKSEEYEFIVKFNPLLWIPTGVYISNGIIHYTPEKKFTPPKVEGTALETIVKHGTLRMYKPDFHCYVYQYGWSLYWITEEGFEFEKDGTTVVQYHLDSTQINRLPQERLDNKWYWDNRSGYYEDYELYGDFGEYRVMKRDLPTEYSVTSITTGYYKNGKWLWKEHFRPYYDFTEQK